MTLDISQLEVSLEEGERWRRTLSIRVPSKMVEAERKAALKQLSTRLKLPGFRAGKVPPSVVEKRFGPALQQEVLDRLIGEAYRGALEDHALKPISEGEVGEIDYEPRSDLKFEISFDVAPHVELARVGGFQVKRPVVEVTDEQVERVLSRIREQEGTWVPEESGAPEDGDMVSVRIVKVDEEGAEARPYEFVLGKDQAIPDVERSIRTLQVGGSGEFTIRFPEEMTHEEHSGTEQRLEIFLDGRKKLDLPELDDALAASVGEFESFDALKEKVEEDLSTEANREADARMRGALIEQIISANPFDIPESMVDQYVRATLGNPEELPADRFEEAKTQLRAGAIHTIKRHIVIDRVAESEGLAASEEEVDARIEEIAEKSGTALSEIYSRLQKSGQLDQLEREITERKVFEFLTEQSEVTPAE